MYFLHYFVLNRNRYLCKFNSQVVYHMYGNKGMDIVLMNCIIQLSERCRSISKRVTKDKCIALFWLCYLINYVGR